MIMLFKNPKALAASVKSLFKKEFGIPPSNQATPPNLARYRYKFIVKLNQKMALISKTVTSIEKLDQIKVKLFNSLSSRDNYRLLENDAGDYYFYICEGNNFLSLAKSPYLKSVEERQQLINLLVNYKLCDVEIIEEQVKFKPNFSAGKVLLNTTKTL